MATADQLSRTQMFQKKKKILYETLKRHPSSMDVSMCVPSVDIINHTKTPYVRSVCLHVLEKSAVVTVVLWTGNY